MQVCSSFFAAASPKTSSITSMFSDADSTWFDGGNLSLDSKSKGVFGVEILLFLTWNFGVPLSISRSVDAVLSMVKFFFEDTSNRCNSLQMSNDRELPTGPYDLPQLLVRGWHLTGLTNTILSGTGQPIVHERFEDKRTPFFKTWILSKN